MSSSNVPKRRSCGVSAGEAMDPSIGKAFRDRKPARGGVRPSREGPEIEEGMHWAKVQLTTDGPHLTLPRGGCFASRLAARGTRSQRSRAHDVAVPGGLVRPGFRLDRSL